MDAPACIAQEEKSSGHDEFYVVGMSSECECRRHEDS